MNEKINERGMSVDQILDKYDFTDIFCYFPYNSLALNHLVSLEDRISITSSKTQESYYAVLDMILSDQEKYGYDAALSVAKHFGLEDGIKKYSRIKAENYLRAGQILLACKMYVDANLIDEAKPIAEQAGDSFLSNMVPTDDMRDVYKNYTSARQCYDLSNLSDKIILLNETFINVVDQKVQQLESYFAKNGRMTRSLADKFKDCVESVELFGDVEKSQNILKKFYDYTKHTSKQLDLSYENAYIWELLGDTASALDLETEAKSAWGTYAKALALHTTSIKVSHGIKNLDLVAKYNFKAGNYSDALANYKTLLRASSIITAHSSDFYISKCMSISRIIKRQKIKESELAGKTLDSE